MTRIVADEIAEILATEGVECITGYPENSLLNSAAKRGIRPVIARTERVAVNMADGISRMSGGRTIGVVATQYGPGAQAAYAAMAQAASDNTPLLYIPSEYARPEQHVAPHRPAERVYASIAAWAVTLNDWSRGPEIFRRAFTLLRNGHGPVVVAVPDDVLKAPSPGAVEYRPALPRRRSAADPRDVEETTSRLLAAERPVILAGQGVLYASACDELLALADLTGTPVATTPNGKSAFPENHPLALGTAGASRSLMVDELFGGADLILGVGTSLTRSLYTTPLPTGPEIGQIVSDARDLGRCYEISFGCVGDAKLVLAQMLERVRDGTGSIRERGAQAEIEQVRQAFENEWRPRLTSEESPINPYRVIHELMQVTDRMRTVVTHDAGNPRDQILPFYESLVPHGYIGWGKSTQLGTGLGLTLGAKIAEPDWLAVNIMGDAAFGMVGMDFETAVRCGLPILTIVLDNGLMGGYHAYMPDAIELYGAHTITGDYSLIARALGGYAERVEQPSELRPALERCIASVESGTAALLEVVTREEPVVPGRT